MGMMAFRAAMALPSWLIKLKDQFYINFIADDR